MRSFLLIFTIFTLASLTALGQGVAINETGTAPNSKAILDISSTTKGFLIPHITTAQRQAMLLTTYSTNGLIVFDTDEKCFYFNFKVSPTQFGWRRLVDDVQNSTLRGASGDSKIDFNYQWSHDDSLYIIFQNTEKYRITAAAPPLDIWP
jgi:hypothetical protein